MITPSVRALVRSTALAFAVAVGCGRAPVELGSDPDFLWSSDHESGTLDDWLLGGAESGAVYATSGDEIAVAMDRARSGRRALRSTITTAGTEARVAQVTRRGSLPDGAYLGAWFYLPAFARPTTYWVFFKLRSVAASGTASDLWDLKLASHSGSELVLDLLRQGTGDISAVAYAPIPINRWFQVEAYFRPAPDSTGRLQIWQDGVLVFDVSGQPTAPTTSFEWSLGSVSDALTPPTAVLYIDDAFMTKRRLDPSFPAFWRGD